MTYDPHWLWIAAGLLLVGIEAVVPGLFLLWVGLAAVATGLIAWLVPLSPTVQLMLFAMLGLLLILIGHSIQNRQSRDVTDSPFLNERGQSLLGMVYPLETAIVNGVGSVRIGDSVWRVTGLATDAGTMVRVSGIEGSTLLVEVV